MVGIVLVSHSLALAHSARSLVQSMTGKGLPLAVSAGAGSSHSELGTDAAEIADAIRSVMSDDGVLVLMDMGSALMSAETAIELLEPSQRERVRFSAAPFLEGAVAAGVTAGAGASLDQVAHEAAWSLRHKQEHLHAEHDAEGSAGDGASFPTPAAGAESIVVTVPNPHGLHARPAARFVREMARFKADVSVEDVTTHKGPVSAKSLSGLESLEALQGHEIRIVATGPQAKEALDSVRTLVEGGLGDMPAAAPAADQPVAPERHRHAQPVAEGIAVGKVIFVEDRAPVIPTDLTTDPDAEKERLRTALNGARAGLRKQREEVEKTAGAEAAEIFAVHLLLLDDPALVRRAEQLIRREKFNAAQAWHKSFEIAQRVQNLKDEYLRQRAADVYDVGRRVLGELGVRAESDLPVDRAGILLADDLTPTQVSQLAGSSALGAICLDGSANSHSGILLRAIGLPSLAQARAVMADFVRHRPPSCLAFDGSTGEIWIDPDEHRLAELNARRERWQLERKRQLASTHEPAITTDRHRVALQANVGQATDAEAAIRFGAEGIGLLRTEFLFLQRSAAPDEEEQVAALVPIFERMEGHPVVARTLDAGGDKDLPYLNLPREANPFLGVRGLRLCLRQPQIFRPQLRALLRAGVGYELRIMFPMVSEPAELDEAIRLLGEAHAELEREGVKHLWPVSIGIMVEVPSAALLADTLAKRCDFFSIGTNDLTQYILAADRQSAELGNFQDALHPAVLLVVRQIVQAAKRFGRKVSVCGEAAGDVQAAMVFVGMGIEELSMTPTAIPAVKSAIRQTSLQELEALALEVMELPNADQIRKRASAVLANAG